MVENELIDDNSLTYRTRLDGTPKLDSFFNKDGLLIRTYSWTVKKALGILVLIHGLNSHFRLEYLKHNADIISNDKAVLIDPDEYYIYKDSWIERLNNEGYSVYGIDLQGHGKSDGWQNLRGNVNYFDDLVYDVIQYINKINSSVIKERVDPTEYSYSNYNYYFKNRLPNIVRPPLYIIGLSMGGNIALRALELIGKSQEVHDNLNIKGCISLAGMVSIDENGSRIPFKYKYFFVPLSRYVAYFFPTFRPSPKMNFEKFPFINDIINFDKNRYDKWITMRFARQILEATWNLQEDMKYIPKEIPLLFIHSKDDCACYYEGAEAFFNKLENNNKELHTLYDMDHLLTMEPGNEKVLDKVITWIKSIREEDTDNSSTQFMDDENMLNAILQIEDEIINRTNERLNLEKQNNDDFIAQKENMEMFTVLLDNENDPCNIIDKELIENNMTHSELETVIN
ncbi:lysophospholipase, putative [Plasmodium sp. gorilla clade G2]|uniref:lysophospholipase, putative n=1 Tax=Plasmodium sp. gorilla clade G2 TaxID=880535 RepID=UPI000D21F4FF|nr:lysophospholipase, putative [Plasmodium sp. gorilla clade G2]SOV17164.1 lysophospholipase, putative [Plasmodium sp. gorilla clade G2]